MYFFGNGNVTASVFTRCLNPKVDTVSLVLRRCTLFEIKLDFPRRKASSSPLRMRNGRLENAKCKIYFKGGLP